MHMAQKPVIALMYDFDKTLSPRDMQEYTFIPKLGMTAAEFWNESNSHAKDNKMDRVLAYMYKMIQGARKSDLRIHKEDFVSLGRDIELFPGVTTWFDRINAFGTENNAEIVHYILSSGLREIIEGTEIYPFFKEVYACHFHYDVNGAADWPSMAVNYTAKTQFLFRINKGIHDISDDDSLNIYVPEDERPIPFRNMVYIGDGLTDVPCMKLVSSYGGQSIAVYQDSTLKTAEELLMQSRVSYISQADYRSGSDLDTLVKSIIRQMVATDALVKKSTEQRSRLQNNPPGAENDKKHKE